MLKLKNSNETFWVIFKHCGISIHWWILLQVVVWLHYKREERGDIWRGGCKSCHNNNGNFTHICLDNPFLPYNDETSNDYTLPKKSWVGRTIRWSNQPKTTTTSIHEMNSKPKSNPHCRSFDLCNPYVDSSSTPLCLGITQWESSAISGILICRTYCIEVWSL